MRASSPVALVRADRKRCSLSSGLLKSHSGSRSMAKTDRAEVRPAKANAKPASHDAMSQAGRIRTIGRAGLPPATPLKAAASYIHFAPKHLESSPPLPGLSNG